MKRRLEILPQAQKDLEYWRKHDLGKYEKILMLTEQACETPKDGLGKPEALKHGLSGCWSRRIDREHRLIYSFDDTTLTIHQARFHY